MRDDSRCYHASNDAKQGQKTVAERLFFSVGGSRISGFLDARDSM